MLKPEIRSEIELNAKQNIQNKKISPIDQYKEAVHSRPTLLFRQVYNYLIEKLAQGTWKEHEKLPSVRSLSEELHVHRLTVFKAYQLLKDTGRIYVKEKSGYYAFPMTKKEYPLPNHLEYHPPENFLLGSDQYSFSQALVDPTLLPNRYFSEYAKKVFDIYPKVLSTYSSVQGDEELRSVLSVYFANTHQLYLEPDNILITTGAQQGIDLITRAFVRQGDYVLIERPTYHAAITIFEDQGAQLIPIDIHAEGYNLAAVEEQMIRYQPRVFYINPTFHNPTGHTIPASQRKKVVELAEKYQCLVVEDDSFRDIYFGDTAPPPPVASYDTEGWVVYIRSFSKYAAPGLRIAALCTHSPRMNALMNYKYRMDNGAPLLNQKVFLLYLASERLTGHLEKLRTALCLRKEAMEQELYQAGWSWDSPKGGLSLWVKLPAFAGDTQSIMERCRQNNVVFSPGIAHDSLRQMDRYIRLSYSFMNEDQIRKGMKILIEAVREGHQDVTDVP
ncbi:DNA-binding transcriptional MocR family regulator [Paenibacillus shirakamiensis]|uniref:DNA-binding transcriptional MocR family regulator n=1 Tax=Paenibacillus shirakamiensis TaxID=1265935 RepID=A0ABS4JGR2_9BACL|nr:PLP-dependent aminotransferase family protein [Paenibacillus shirakamiensis]MBP2000230.1 DNA-binding transcriptional MocR family regulator [Paenibacillus shirakamiensis]